MSTKRASVDEIQGAIERFVRGLPVMERSQFNRVFAILKDLSIDTDGRIKPTLDNLKIMSRAKNELERLVNSDKYVDKVAQLRSAIGKVADVQTLYFETAFTDFEPSKLVSALEQIAFENVTQSLAGAGVQSQVVMAAQDLIEQHVRDSSTITSLIDKLKGTIVTVPGADSKLVSYSKGIINDTLSGFSRNYHKLITQDLGLQWFEYLGALIDTSRPFCKAMVKKRYVHITEFPTCARGVIDGQKVSLDGMMPGTSGINLQDRCGGFNCSHQLVPIQTFQVPEALRKKFEKPKEAE